MATSDEPKPTPNYRRYIGISLLAVVAVLGGATYVLLKPVPLEDDAPEVVEHAHEHAPTESAHDLSISSTEAKINPDGSSRTAIGSKPWTLVEEQEVDSSLIPAYKEIVEGRVLVAISDELSDLEEADNIDLYIPQLEQTYKTTVDEVKVSLGSNRVYKGHMMSGENPYFYVITVGPKFVFGHFETPNGSYELFGNRSLAWLMPTKHMDQNIDYSRPDYIVPDVDPIPDNLKDRFPTEPKEQTER